MQKRKVYLVDDHPVVREGLEKYINSEEDLMVCGQAESVDEAYKWIKLIGPDIVIVDIILKDSNGIDLVKMINKEFKIPVLVLSMYDEKIYVERSLRAGAMGYINKNESMLKVIKAIRNILDGEIFIDDKFKNSLVTRFIANSDPQIQTSVENLTNRELEVFQFIGKGLGTREVAEKLSLSIKTIETYRDRIKRKLNLKNASELAQYAILWNSSMTFK